MPYWRTRDTEKMSKYCSEPCNHEANTELPPDGHGGQPTHPPQRSAGCSTNIGVDNIPAKLVQTGAEEGITALTAICDKIWRTGKWPTPWTIRRIRAIEMRCYRMILHISYKDHVTNEEVRAKIQQANGPHEDLLTIVKRRKLL